MSNLSQMGINTTNLARINPLFLPLPWIIVIALLAVFVTMKYTSTESSAPAALAAEKIFPHMFLTEAEVRHYDATGNLHYQMNSPLIRSFQTQQKPSSEDYSLFQTPVFILVNNPKEAGWLVTADEGRLDGNNEWFSLSEQVVARQTTEQQGETIITTSNLRLNTREQFAETSKAVSMRTAKGQINGIGLRADMKRDHIELLSQVKGTYEP